MVGLNPIGLRSIRDEICTGALCLFFHVKCPIYVECTGICDEQCVLVDATAWNGCFALLVPKVEDLMG